MPFAALAWLDAERIGTTAFALASVLSLVVLDQYGPFTDGDRVAAAAAAAVAQSPVGTWPTTRL